MSKRKKHPILTGILVVVILLIVIGALGSKSDKATPANVAEDPAPTETVAEEPSQEPEEAADASEDAVEPEAPAEEQTEFGVGDAVTQNDITVTLLDMTENRGSAYNKPSDGNVYILFEFEIENNKSTDLNVSSLMNFECYCDDYSTNLSLSAMIEKGNKNQLDGTVAAGKKMNGVVGYEVPADWSELEIRYTPSGFFMKEFKFIVNRE